MPERERTMLEKYRSHYGGPRVSPSLRPPIGKLDRVAGERGGAFDSLQPA